MSFNTALSSGQLEALRGASAIAPSHSARFLISLCPNTNVYTAQVNQTVFGTSFAQIAYVGGSGTLADVVVGMTVLIGHTSDRKDAFFVGRVRKAPTSTILYINETSAPVADGDYIFVLDDFRIWDKLARMDGSTLKVDYDLTFRQLLPLISNLKSAYAVYATSVPYSFSFAPTVDPATSGATISSYLWDVQDGTITVGSTTTKDITVTFPAGFRWIYFTATDNGSRALTRRIPIWVHNSSYPPTLLEHGDLTVEASLDDGFAGSVSAFDGIDAILDNALIVAWSDQEQYNGTTTTIDDNIILIGRLRTETNQTEYDQDTGQIDAQTRFDIESPLQQLGRLEMKNIQMDVHGTPTKFGQIKVLTLWREIAYVLSEFSTFSELHSLTFSDTTDTYREKGIVTQANNLHSVIDALANGINAKFQMNAGGEAEVARDAVLLPTADRDALVTVADWTTADLLSLSLSHDHVNPIGWLESSGGSYNATSGKVTVAQAVAPGRAMGSGGESATLHNQILTYNQSLAQSETELCIRAGHKIEKDQGADEITIDHPDGYWFLTPSVNQWYTFTLSAAEMAKEIALDDTIRWLLVSISLTFELETGNRSVSAVYRRETIGTPAQAIRYPPSTTNPFPMPQFPTIPSFPGLDIPLSFYLPDLLTSEQAPPLLSGTPGVLLRDGNTAVTWTERQVFVCQDLLTSFVPTWIEVTPPIGDGDLVVQCRFTGTNPPGLIVAVKGPGWEHTMDFDPAGSTRQGTDQVASGWFTPSLAGDFVSGSGWEGELAARVSDGVFSKFIAIGIDFDRDIFFTGIDVEMLSPDPLPMFRGLTVGRPPLGATQGPADIINLYFVQPGGSPGLDTWVWNGNETADSLIFWSEFATGDPLAEDQTFDAQVIRSITFRGIGYNPFNPAESAGSRVFYASNAFDVAIDWSEGEGLPTEDIAAMRLGTTLNRVYMWDAVEGETFYSADYGETFDDADPDGGTPPASPAGIDTQKLGNVVLVGVDGQVQRAITAGGSYSAYGDPLPTGARPTTIFIPRYKFAGTNNGSGISAPDYLLASDTQASGESLWKVTASGVTFTAITPNDGSADGLALGPNSLHIPWNSNAYQDILALMNFGGSRKLARSINGGSTWVISSALHAQSNYVTTRRSDTNRSQVFVTGGPNIAYSSNYRASPLVLVTLAGPTADTLLGIDIWW